MCFGRELGFGRGLGLGFGLELGLGSGLGVGAGEGVEPGAEVRHQHNGRPAAAQQAVHAALHQVRAHLWWDGG